MLTHLTVPLSWTFAGPTVYLIHAGTIILAGITAAFVELIVTEFAIQTFGTDTLICIPRSSFTCRVIETGTAETWIVQF